MSMSGMSMVLEATTLTAGMRMVLKAAPLAFALSMVLEAASLGSGMSLSLETAVSLWSEQFVGSHHSGRQNELG